MATARLGKGGAGSNIYCAAWTKNYRMWWIILGRSFSGTEGAGAAPLG